jgi:hypothetical protein
MLNRKRIITLLASLVLTWLTSVSVVAQECGYSFNTFYIVNDKGEHIKDVRIESANSEVMEAEHFNVITEVRWDQKLGAYLVSHGLCGSHADVPLKFSADGYEVAVETIDMTFGKHGYTLNLKRKGTNEKASLSRISCTAQPKRCVQWVSQ